MKYLRIYSIIILIITLLFIALFGINWFSRVVTEKQESSESNTWMYRLMNRFMYQIILLFLCYIPVLIYLFKAKPK